MSFSDKKNYLTLIWEIENFELILEAKDGCWLVAPVSEVRGSGRSWDKLAVGCRGSDIVFQLSCIKTDWENKRCCMKIVSNCDEVFLKQEQSGPFSCSIERNSIYKQPILSSNGTLTLHCRVWKKKMDTQEFRIYSVLQRVDIRRKHLYPSQNVIIEKDHVLIEMNIAEGSKKGIHEVTLEGVIGIDRSLSFVDCKVLCEHCLVKDTYYWYNSMQTRCKVTFKIPDLKNWNTEFQVSCIVAIHKSSPHHQAHPSSTESVKIFSDKVAASSGPLEKDLLHMSREALPNDASLKAETKSFSVPTLLENVCTVSVCRSCIVQNLPIKS